MWRLFPDNDDAFARRAAVLTYPVALAVQLAAYLALRPPASPLGDPGYAANATRLLYGGYADTFKPPLYSLFLVVPMALDDLGPSFYLWQMAVFALSPPLTWLIARRLGLSRRVAGLAVGLELLYPYYALAFTQLLETGLAILAVKALLWSWLAASRSEQPWGWPACGLAFGLATLVRPNLWTVLPLLILCDRGARRQGWGLRYLLFAVGLTVALLPWLQHTWRVTGRASPTPTNAGYNMLAGHNPYAVDYLLTRGKVLEDTLKDHPQLLATSPGLDLLERDRELFRRGLEFARRHPAQELGLVPLKAAAYLSPVLERPYGWTKQLAYTVPYVTVLLLAAFGVRAARASRWPDLGLVLGFLALYMLPFLIFIATIRMRMPTEFLLLLLAAIGLDDLLTRAGLAPGQGPKTSPPQSTGITSQTPETQTSSPLQKSPSSQS